MRISNRSSLSPQPLLDSNTITPRGITSSSILHTQNLLSRRNYPFKTALASTELQMQTSYPNQTGEREREKQKESERARESVFPPMALPTTVIVLLLLCPVALCSRQQKIQNSVKDKVGFFPPSCSRIECPGYQVVGQGDGFEIRQYNHTAWTSTQAIDDISLVDATRTGFLQ